MRFLSALCAVVLFGGSAAAQPGPAGDAPADDSPAAEVDAVEDEDLTPDTPKLDDGQDSVEEGVEPEGAAKPTEGSAVVPVAQQDQADEEARPLSPPPEPTASDQTPRPYLEEPEPIGPARAIELGPQAGLWYRGASEGTGVSYGLGFAVGAFARVDLMRWLGLRLFFLRGWHPVSVDDGALGLAEAGFPNASVDQNALGSTTLGARLEPTWRLGPVLALWAGAGAAWVRLVQEPPETANPRLRLPYRAGVGVELQGSLGVSAEVVRDWLVLGAHATAGFVTSQSGDLFADRQAIDLETGQRLFLEGLPEIGASLGGFVTVGVLL